jgi:hypothetical protein
MKSKFYLLLLAPILILASCTKSNLDAPANVVGNWQLESVEKSTSYGSQPVSTGYEYGTFYLRNNGSAQYSDNAGTMDGSWRTVSHSDGSSGNGYSNSLELRLYDYYDNRVIEWEFYSIEFTSGGSRMIGYMNRFGNEYRYVFSR